VTNRTAARLAWSLAALSILLAVVGDVFSIKNDPSLASVTRALSDMWVIAFGVLGALLASRRSSNPIGWLFLASAVLFSVGVSSNFVAEYGLVKHPGSVPGADIEAWFAKWVWMPATVVLLVFSPLLFPNGRLPSRRWRPVAGLAAVAALVSTVPVAIEGWPLRGSQLLYGDEPPLNLPHSYRLAVAIEEIVFTFVIFPLAFAAAASLVVRLRRSKGDEREQIRWFAFGAFVMVVGLVASIPGLPGGDAARIVGFGALPAAATIAILKYRLYDIDVVINKTVVYGVLAAVFTIVYVAIVVGIGTLVGSRSSRPLTVLAAVVMAVVFQPVRERARRFANRLVYGKRATPYEVLSAFSARVGDAYDAEDILPQMVRTLADGTGAARAEVWLRVGGELRPAASWPSDPVPAAPLILDGEGLPPFPGAERSFPVRHQGDLLGALVVVMPPNEPLTPAGENLIGDLASQAGLVLRNVRLIEELRASRQRLVAAQDQERRRLERNLHDGAQQQLVSLGIQLGLAEKVAAKESPNVAGLLEKLRTQAGEALDDLRDLARGIYSPLLADQGLAAALSAQARKASIEVEVETDGIGRYPQEAEAAVYFCCLEALQNVAKYAGTTKARISLEANGTDLAFSVADDGKGFDPQRTPMGAGLQNNGRPTGRAGRHPRRSLQAGAGHHGDRPPTADGSLRAGPSFAREHHGREHARECTGDGDRREDPLGRDKARDDGNRAEFERHTQPVWPTHRHRSGGDQRQQIGGHPTEQRDARAHPQMALARASDQQAQARAHRREPHEQRQVRVRVDHDRHGRAP
jgi:signal transduction histidine kinase